MIFIILFKELFSITSPVTHYFDNISKISNTFDHIASANRDVINAVFSIKPILPISLIKDISLIQDTLNSLYISLNLIDWKKY